MIERYSSEHMRYLWSDEHKYAVWSEVESAVLQVHGIDYRYPVPTPAQVVEKEKVTRHDVAGYLDAVRDLVAADPDAPPEAAQLLHAGMTSSDLVDTALGIRLRDSIKFIREATAATVTVLFNRADELAGQTRAARTHGRYAEPAQVSDTLKRWAYQFVHSDRRLWKKVWLGKISGATGQHLTINQMQEYQILASLNLSPARHATQIVPRWSYNEVYFALAELAGACADVGNWVRLGSIQDVDEVWERQHPGQVGSTAMPHKTRNPIQSEKIVGLARYARGLSNSLQDAAHQIWWERDLTTSSLERTALPDLMGTVEYLLDQTTELVSGLVFNTGLNSERADFTPSSIQLWEATQAGEDPVQARKELHAQSRPDQPDPV